MKVIVIGAGVIGSLTAYHLARSGADVTVIDALGPASGASGASFGWINASFYLDAPHFHLRQAGIEAHHRLQNSLETAAIRWQRCLCWEETGDAFDAQYGELQKLGYPVRVLSRDEVSALEPEITPPDRALMFECEGVANLCALTADALTAAQSSGAKLITGVTVDGIVHRSGRITGVRWSGGTLACDKVVVAAGVSVPDLLFDTGISVPMLDRPGVIMRSAVMPPLLAHILVTPEGEIRQDASGRLIVPTAVSHQSDATTRINSDPRSLASAAATRVSGLMNREITWDSVALAYRPVPGDQRPVIGPAGPQGMHIAVMHSGATLCAIAAEITALEVLEAPLSKEFETLVAPYKPQRFTG